MCIRDRADICCGSKSGIFWLVSTASTAAVISLALFIGVCSFQKTFFFLRSQALGCAKGAAVKCAVLWRRASDRVRRSAQRSEHWSRTEARDRRRRAERDFGLANEGKKERYRGAAERSDTYRRVTWGRGVPERGYPSWWLCRKSRPGIGRT